MTTEVLSRLALAFEAAASILRGAPVAVNLQAAPAQPTGDAPAAGSPAPAQPARRGRGRPVQGETPPAVTSAQISTTPAPAAADDDFLSTEPTAPAKVVELADVRAALVAYQKRTGSPEKARKLLADHGAQTLAQLPQDVWQKVIDAAAKAS